MFDVHQIRKDFPILERKIGSGKLVYFDNGATTQKPLAVINAITEYYTNYNANIHRGVHTLSQEASAAYENARTIVQQHLNAEESGEIIFTRGTTESVNLVAHSFLRNRLQAGDEILITAMEHHSNIIPWQLLCEERNAVLKVVPIFEDGTLDIEAAEKLMNGRTRMFACTHVSNTLGTINPVKHLTSVAHSKGIPVLIDGAQSVPHMKADVKDIDCDFYCFSGHKIYAPTGIGVLYVKRALLNEMVPYQGGGGIIKTVTFAKTEYAEGPLKFEAGTPNIEGSIALGVALNYFNNVGAEAVAAHENELLQYATRLLKEFQGMKFIGEAKDKAGVISFVTDGIHPYDIGTILDQQGVAVRTGHHCTQPLMDYFKIPGTVRISFGMYNTREEVDLLIQALHKAFKMLR
ncbi:MAG: cysteine desulfurase [Bacteroidia bacterium]